MKLNASGIIPFQLTKEYVQPTIYTWISHVRYRLWFIKQLSHAFTMTNFKSFYSTKYIYFYYMLSIVYLPSMDQIVTNLALYMYVFPIK